MKYISVLSAVLMSLPRVAPAYGAYTITPIVFAELLPMLRAMSVVVGVSVVGALLSALTENVSIAAVVIQTALVAPFFLGIMGVSLNRKLVDPLQVIRTLNVLFFIGGMINIISMGFPARLPYVHFLPDYFWGFFGLGGAKIGTVIGFFGIATELYGLKGKRPTRLTLYFIILAAFNFMMPNFLIGIFAGLLGLGIMMLRHPKYAMVALLPLPLLLGYAAFRVDNIESSFSRMMGAHPKVYQAVIVADVYLDHPEAVLVGVGPGQFGGQAALWPSPAGDLLSSRSRPNLPGLFASSIHMNYLAPVLLQFRDNVWAISSTANKPYSSVSIIMVEHGLPLLLLAILLSFSLYVNKRNLSTFETIGVFVFVWTLLFVDVQHDAPWFGFCLMAFNSLIRENK